MMTMLFLQLMTTPQCSWLCASESLVIQARQEAKQIENSRAKIVPFAVVKQYCVVR